MNISTMQTHRSNRPGEHVMSLPSLSRISSLAPRSMPLAALAAALALTWFCPDATAAGSKQPHYASAEEAATALIQASKGSEANAVITVLGPGSDPLVLSGDAVADEKARQHFVAEYEAAHKLVSISDGEIEMVLGTDE